MAINLLPDINQSKPINLLPDYEPKSEKVDTILGKMPKFNFNDFNSEKNIKDAIDAAAGSLNVGSGINLAKKGYNFLKGLKSSNLTENALNMLGRGARNLEENANSLASDLKSAHDLKMKEALSYKNPVMQKYGKEEIYPIVNPSGINAYREKMPKLINAPSNIKSLYKEFISNPTLENADKIQSEMGKEIGYLKRIYSKDSNQIKQMNDMVRSRNSIKNKMDSMLMKLDPEAANNYKKFTDLYREEVVPYYSDNVLRKIISGEETNPKNIHNIFEYPTDVVSRDAEKSMGPINKILSHLPEESKGKILYSKIGGHSDVKDINKLFEKLEKAEQKGYSSYFNNDIKNMLLDLNKKNNIKNSILKYGLPIGGGLVGAAGVRSLSNRNKNAIIEPITEHIY